MSTPPTQQPPPPPAGQPPPTQTWDRPYYGPGPGLPTIPGFNGELVVFLLVWFVVLIVTLAAAAVDWPQFVTATVVLAVGYMIARGIAKASRVYEGR